MSLRAPDHGAWLFRKETLPTCHCDERSKEAIPNCEGTLFRGSFLGGKAAAIPNSEATSHPSGIASRLQDANVRAYPRSFPIKMWDNINWNVERYLREECAPVALAPAPISVFRLSAVCWQASPPHRRNGVRNRPHGINSSYSILLHRCAGLSASSRFADWRCICWLAVQYAARLGLSCFWQTQSRLLCRRSHQLHL